MKRYIKGNSNRSLIDTAVSNDSISNPPEIVKENSENEIKFSDRDSDSASLDTAAIRYFGKTKRWNETGYLLKDGTMLDFSGKKNGAPGGYRTEDHRAITDVYDELEDISFNGDSLSDGMIDYMSRGNIRIMPESNGINLSQLPTQAQENALNNFIKNADGEVVVDFDNEYGDTVESAEYPIGTRADRVLRDIRRYFKDGISPEISDISKFMYSDRYSNLVRSNEQNERL